MIAAFNPLSFTPDPSIIDNSSFPSAYGTIRIEVSEGNTLVLASVPVDAYIDSIMEIFGKADGFENIILAPPVLAGKDIVRGVLIQFVSAEKCRQELLRHQHATASPIPVIKINTPRGFVGLPLSTAVEKRARRVPGSTGFAQTDRLAIDLAQALKIAAKLDSHYGFPSWLERGDSLLHVFERVEEKISMTLAYLRETHHFCYYCARQFVDEEEMYGNCGVVCYKLYFFA